MALLKQNGHEENLSTANAKMAKGNALKGKAMKYNKQHCLRQLKCLYEQSQWYDKTLWP
jgi:hypothetical protein